MAQIQCSDGVIFSFFPKKYPYLTTKFVTFLCYDNFISDIDHFAFTHIHKVGEHMRKPYLSKTLFLRGLQCHKALWLLKKRPDLAVEPDSALLAVFEEGQKVGKLAQGLFPGGVVVEFERDKGKMLKKTTELLEQGAETIYEATFSFDNIFVMVDILHRTDDGWEIYEVKSGTTVKAINLPDLAIQYHVLTGAGLSITKASLIHINNSYERHGPIDIQQLFTIEDSTEEIRGMQERVKQDIEAM